MHGINIAFCKRVSLSLVIGLFLVFSALIPVAESANRVSQSTDRDQDGISDRADNCPIISNGDQGDTDRDGMGDACDKDDDNDGRRDPVDACPTDPDDSIGDPCNHNDCRNRSPRDEVGDPCNHLDCSDLTRRDLRGDPCNHNDCADSTPRDDVGVACDHSDCADLSARDTVGDPCNHDEDGDGRLDPVDNCPLIANGNQRNNDGDGAGDACDLDDDNDFRVDTEDNCPLLFNSDQANTDGDTEGDFCDTDDDNDGRTDATDTCPTDPDDSVGDPCNHDDDGGCVPSDLRVTTRRCNDLRLEWRINPASCSTSGYRIYRDGVEWARRPSSQAILEDAMTIPAFTHEYRVVALDAGGLSQGEDRLSVTIPECAPPPPLLRTKVLYFRFSDFPEEFTLPDGTLVNNTFFDNIVFSSPSGSLNAYLNEVSYNQTAVRGEVYGPFTLPRLPSEYCSGTLPSGGHLDCSLPLIRTDVLSIVDPLIDFTGTDLVILAVNGLTGGYAAGSLSTNEDNENYFIVLGSSHYFTTSPGFANPTLVHELGHQIGNLFHAGSWRCPAGSGPGPNLDNLLEGGCLIERYGDVYSSMGVNSFHYNAWHKELLGFIRGTQITTVPGTSGVYEYTLDALEVVSDGIKEIKIPLGEGRFYFLEYRKPIELDAWTYSDGWQPMQDAVQVRLKVARLVSSDADTLFMNNSGLTVGVPFEDTYRGIRIELLEKSIGPSGLQARVRITRTP